MNASSAGNATGAARRCPPHPEPGWAAPAGPGGAWVWVPALAAVIGVLVPIACVVAALVVGHCHSRRGDGGGGADEESARGAARRPDIGPAIPWADEPLHSTLGRGAAFTVYQAVIPPGASTLLHSHVGVTAYVVVSAPPSPIRTETVEWACEETDGDGPAMPARLVPGQMALAPGAAFAFVVPDPRRPLVHRIFCPPGEAPARIVGVEVRGGGGREEGPPPPPPAPPFTVAASGPGFRTLRTVLAPGEACGAPAVRPPAVAITVRGGGAGLGGPPASLFVRAARADQGVAWTEGEVEPGCTLVNGGPGEWECCIVELL